MLGKRRIKLVKLLTNQDRKKNEERSNNEFTTSRRRLTRYEPLPAITPRPKLNRENTYKVLEPLLIRTPQDYFKYKLFRAKSDSISLSETPNSTTPSSASSGLANKVGRSPREHHLDPLPRNVKGRSSRSSNPTNEGNQTCPTNIKPEKKTVENRKRVKALPETKLKTFESDPSKNAFWIPV